MPAKIFRLERSARKNFLKIPTNIHIRIVEAFRLIKKNPYVGEKLHGELKGYYKLRLGDYRIVYSFDKKSQTVAVVKIEHRQGIYK